MADRYSEDPVTDAAIRATVEHHPKCRALCVLAREARDDTPVGATTEDLQALVGAKIKLPPRRRHPRV